MSRLGLSEIKTLDTVVINIPQQGTKKKFKSQVNSPKRKKEAKYLASPVNREKGNCSPYYPFVNCLLITE